jgi:cell division protein FtsB
MVRPVTAFAGTMVILALLVVPYVRPWIAQQSELASGRAQVAELARQVAALQAERSRWNDPAYVRAQARQRLHYVLPGETGYVVLDDRQKVTRSLDPRQAAVSVPQQVPGASSTAWYTKVWQSIRIAGDPSTAEVVDGGGVPVPGTDGAGLVAPGPSVSVGPAPVPAPSASRAPSATRTAGPTRSPHPTPTR